jgi:hypothetical protein
VSAGSRLGSHRLLFELGRRLGLAPEQADSLLLPQQVAIALDVDRGGVIEQAVQESSSTCRSQAATVSMRSWRAGTTSSCPIWR